MKTTHLTPYPYPLQLSVDMVECVLRRRRRSRVCPRAVRKGHSPYRAKKPGEGEVARHLIPQIRLGTA